MNKSALTLTRLTLVGSGVPNAEVRFQSGLNVIVGPSDTGKTFIAQCIDFVMGSSGGPKEISEAAAYQNVELGLRTRENEQEIVLVRSLRGGDISLQVRGEAEVRLGAKHQPGKTDTLSFFLLGHTGLAGRKLRTNKRGKTRELSFRDLARLVLVDEEDVISEKSPIFSGQNTSKTAETCVFRLLLTGVDDSGVILADDSRAVKGKQEGRSELIEKLLEQTRAQISALQLAEDLGGLREQLARIETLFNNASAELATEQQSAVALEERRREAWERLRQVDSRLGVLSELQGRFGLLRAQYASDLKRLEAISEAGIRLEQIPEERCPICGAPAEHHDREHLGQEPVAAPEEVVGACQHEAQKIRTLIADLQSTMTGNATELNRLREEQSKQQSALSTAGDELRERLQPRLKKALQDFRDSQSRRDSYRDALALHNRVAELEKLLAEAANAPSTGHGEIAQMSVGTAETETFSREVEKLLQAWEFPGLDRVTFNDYDQDIVISGRRRSSHGKGVRAVTHAAFNLGLLAYCGDKALPHPGFVLIDSPLIVYKEPDKGEGGFSRAVKDAFYRSIAEAFKENQVIIIENDVPPADVGSSINTIEFTGASHGRRGFIP